MSHFSSRSLSPDEEANKHQNDQNAGIPGKCKKKHHRSQVWNYHKDIKAERIPVPKGQFPPYSPFLKCIGFPFPRTLFISYEDQRKLFAQDERGIASLILSCSSLELWSVAPEAVGGTVPGLEDAPQRDRVLP